MKTTKSVLASPAKLRAIADRLERETREAVAELRRLADLGEGTAKVKAKSAANAKKKAKAKKPRAAKAAKKSAKAPAKKTAKKTARPVAKKTAKAKAPANKKLRKLLNRKPAWANGHDHQAQAR